MTRRAFRLRVVALLISSLLTLSGVAAKSKTNIVLIMADDIGYECYAVHGGTCCTTPRIDRVPAEDQAPLRFERSCEGVTRCFTDIGFAHQVDNQAGQ